MTDDKCTAVVDQVKSVEAVSLLKQFESEREREREISSKVV